MEPSADFLYFQDIISNFKIYYNIMVYNQYI